ncbi:MAG: hypothetical protein A3E83_06310 [Gammaproteobacteria bacterium RIFCSPHIGHO2_12_FULL_41_20]|nr:MAG: hypothetical protein A3E83_06310 [Gammaproteobacteria bacterium RIFCSPHIGHO2_12_FULL_41_20]
MRHVPAHAYDFSVAIVLGVSTAISYAWQADPYKTVVLAIATLGCITHGAYDLYKEGRLGKALGLPFFRRHVGIIKSAANHPNESRGELHAAKPS